jgi:preprotein translocase subunit SecE
VTADKLKLYLAALVLGASVVAFYYLEQQSIFVQIAALIGGIVIAIGISMQSAQGQAAWAFARDARTELRKVVWPTSKETVQTTGIVMVIVALIALFLWFVDWSLVQGVGYLRELGTKA